MRAYGGVMVVAARMTSVCEGGAVAVRAWGVTVTGFAAGAVCACKGGTVRACEGSTVHAVGIVFVVAMRMYGGVVTGFMASMVAIAVMGCASGNLCVVHITGFAASVVAVTITVGTRGGGHSHRVRCARHGVCGQCGRHARVGLHGCEVCGQRGVHMRVLCGHCVHGSGHSRRVCWWCCCSPRVWGTIGMHGLRSRSAHDLRVHWQCNLSVHVLVWSLLNNSGRIDERRVG